MADKKGQKKAAAPAPTKASRTLKGGVTKAWKQGKPPEARIPKKKARTPERVIKDEQIRAHREKRREDRIAAAAQRKADEEAARVAEALEAELALQPTPVGVAVKTKRLAKKAAPKKAMKK